MLHRASKRTKCCVYSLPAERAEVDKSNKNLFSCIAFGGVSDWRLTVFMQRHSSEEGGRVWLFSDVGQHALCDRVFSPILRTRLSFKHHANDCSLHLAKHQTFISVIHIGCKHTTITQVWQRLWSLRCCSFKLKRWRCKQTLIKVKSESEEIAAPGPGTSKHMNPDAWNHLIINYHGEGR